MKSVKILTNPSVYIYIYIDSFHEKTQSRPNARKPPAFQPPKSGSIGNHVHHLCARQPGRVMYGCGPWHWGDHIHWMMTVIHHNKIVYRGAWSNVSQLYSSIWAGCRMHLQKKQTVNAAGVAPIKTCIYRAIYAYIEKCSSDPTLNVQASCGTSCSTAGSGDAKSKAFHLVGCAP